MIPWQVLIFCGSWVLWVSSFPSICLICSQQCGGFEFGKLQDANVDASSLLQVLFFGFGWLFFMRKLFKDYEVRRSLSFQVCILKNTPNYRNIFKTAFRLTPLFNPFFVICSSFLFNFLLCFCLKDWISEKMGSSVATESFHTGCC